MHDAAEESSDDDKDAVSPDDRRDGARGGDSYDMITKSPPYVKCNPLALNATNNARKSSWSIFAGRFPSKRS